MKAASAAGRPVDVAYFKFHGLDRVGLGRAPLHGQRVDEREGAAHGTQRIATRADRPQGAVLGSAVTGGPAARARALERQTQERDGDRNARTRQPGLDAQ